MENPKTYKEKAIDSINLLNDSINSLAEISKYIEYTLQKDAGSMNAEECKEFVNHIANNIITLLDEVEKNSCNATIYAGAYQTTNHLESVQ